MALLLIGSDKLQHFVGLFLLALLGSLGWGAENGIRLGFWLAALGGGIELVQTLIERDGALLDLLADIVGIVAAYIAVRAWSTWQR